MFPDYLNLNFWSLYFHNSINSLLLCLLQLYSHTPETSKLQCVAFAGHALFYLLINIMRLELVFDICFDCLL